MLPDEGKVLPLEFQKNTDLLPNRQLRLRSMPSELVFEKRV